MPLPEPASSLRMTLPLPPPLPLPLSPPMPPPPLILLGTMRPPAGMRGVGVMSAADAEEEEARGALELTTRARTVDGPASAAPTPTKCLFAEGGSPSLRLRRIVDTTVTCINR